MFTRLLFILPHKLSFRSANSSLTFQTHSLLASHPKALWLTANPGLLIRTPRPAACLLMSPIGIGRLIATYSLEAGSFSLSPNSDCFLENHILMSLPTRVVGRTSIEVLKTACKWEKVEPLPNSYRVIRTTLDFCYPQKTRIVVGRYLCPISQIWSYWQVTFTDNLTAISWICQHVWEQITQ